MNVATTIGRTLGTGRAATIVAGVAEGALKGGMAGTAAASLIITGRIQTANVLARPGALKQAALLTTISSGVGAVTGAVAGGVRGALLVAR
jgi:hypothetical protein